MKSKIRSVYCGLIMSMIFFSCNRPVKEKTSISVSKLDIQGHRGARGLMPENTIPAFIRALELGVTTLEMDLAVTKGKQLVVSHEPYMNPEMCLDSLGQEISSEEQYQHNIYQMTLDQIQSFDCGIKPHPRFPKQEKTQAIKPLLIDVVNAVNDYLLTNRSKRVYYNIEIKSMPEGDDLFHPSPEEFSDLVYDFIQKNMKPEFVNVQSFDFRVLQYFRKTYPNIKLALLIENKNTIDQNLKELGFIPEIYSCDHTLLTKENITYLQSKEMKVIPWTVNTTKEMNQLIKWNVDGIITDYPDSLQRVIQQ